MSLFFAVCLGLLLSSSAFLFHNLTWKPLLAQDMLGLEGDALADFVPSSIARFDISLALSRFIA